MPNLPSATIRIEEKAGAAGALSDMIAVFGCCPLNADKKPRVYASTAAMQTAHGYCDALEYVALHMAATRKPVVFVPLPVTTAGDVTLSTSGNTGTSVITLTKTGAGTTCYAATNGILTVVTGGAIGTANIVLTLSLDGGRVTKTVKLGTANSYIIPDVGLTLAFAPGTLVAGDTCATWTSTAPMWSAADFDDGRELLAAQQRRERSWLVAEVCTAALAANVNTSVGSYETQNERFKTVRVQARDIGVGDSDKADWIATVDTEYAGIDAAKRISLGLGFGAMLSPITGWKFRRPVQWAAAIREYQHDYHITTWRKEDGPIDNFDIYNDNGDLIEFDETIDGGGLSGRFTCVRSYANDNGTYIAMDLTRETEGKRLSRYHNMQVVNLACSVCHAATERAIGKTPVLNDDGTILEAEALKIENSVNVALESALLADKGEGQRASKAVWTMSRFDDLSVVGATVNGTLELNLNGTIEQIATTVKVG